MARGWTVPRVVIPAKAGIHGPTGWTPAFAGVTTWRPSLRLTRFLRACGSRRVQGPGALPPDPRHFPLCTNGMVGKQATRDATNASRQRWRGKYPCQPERSSSYYHAIGKSDKCQGFGGRAPNRHRSARNPEEPFLPCKAHLVGGSDSGIIAAARSARRYCRPDLSRGPGNCCRRDGRAL